MAADSDPVADGLVTSLARPGGNITGLSTRSRDLPGKHLELLKEAIPSLSRVVVLWNPANTAARVALTETEAAAHSLGIQLQSLEVRAPTPDLEGTLQAASQEGAMALMVIAAFLTKHYRAVIVAMAVKHRIPAMSTEPEYMPAGGLMSYATNIDDLYRRAAIYVDKILKGARPGDLPIEQPTTFELVINLKTAQALGQTIPTSLLFQATEVIR
jgi:putative tryptophan/tyrosine transport system substrate-binding protein